MNLSLAQLLPFVVFAFVASITPGPTNLLILGSAVSRGLLAAMPLVLGAAVGAAGLVVVVGLGLGEVFLRFPLLQQVMAWVGMGWITWLGWQLFRSPASAIEGDGGVRRVGALQGAGMQLINPKTWIMALSVVSVCVGVGAGMATYCVYAGVFLLVALPCLALWAVLGVGAARVLRSAVAVQRFNQGMAVLLVVSVWGGMFC
ncbi:MAG: LysE family translocator [Paucimonas sp.]|jgi:threonine/homoserine/homoserine lactone efflux protein|nr:LysE family translocator [Paucimonas sp.]